MDRSSDIQQRVSSCWNLAASDYDAQPGHGLQSEEERSAWVDLLRGALPLAPADTLDIGTGTGFMAFRAHELGHRVTAADLAESMLDVARRAGSDRSTPPTFLLGDAMAPPLPEASFDAVMNRHLLWTLHDPPRALRAWHGLLRPHGRLLLIDGVWNFDQDDERTEHGSGQPGDEDEHDKRDEFYSEEVLSQLPLTRARSIDDVIDVVRAAGFRDIQPLDLSTIYEAEGHLESTRGRYGLVARR